MVDTKFPKFRWETLSDQNSGHTRNEWGMQEKPNIRKIIAYTVSWDDLA